MPMRLRFRQRLRFVTLHVAGAKSGLAPAAPRIVKDISRSKVADEMAVPDVAPIRDATWVGNVFVATIASVRDRGA